MDICLFMKWNYVISWLIHVLIKIIPKTAKTNRLAKKLKIADKNPKIDFSFTNIDAKTSSYFIDASELDILLVFH